MANPATPTVPNAQGVPPVSGAAAAPASVTPATSDGNAIVVTGAQLKWGIHLPGGADYFANSVGPDSYIEVDDNADWSIPDYPTETGGFESYNKVTKPGTVQLILAKGGTQQSKQAFRNALDALAASTTLVNILTPGRTYRGYNLTRVGATRTAEKGVGLIQVNVTFTQVRTTVSLKFSQVSDPSAFANVSGGAVQTQTPTGNQAPGSPPS
jgi:hypothetical protein